MINKFNYRIACIMALSVMLCASAPAQEKSVKMKDCPPAVQKTIQEQSQGAAIRGISKETDKGKTVYELELMVNGHSKDMLIDTAGNVIEVEEQMAINQLPAPVRTEIERQAGKGKITKLESLSKGGAVVAYEAVIKTGAKSREVKVDTGGKLIPGK